MRRNQFDRAQAVAAATAAAVDWLADGLYLLLRIHAPQRANASAVQLAHHRSHKAG